MTITSRTTLSEIVAMASEQGFSLSKKEASQIKTACKIGAFVWSRDRIVTVDSSRITKFPD